MYDRSLLLTHINKSKSRSIGQFLVPMFQFSEDPMESFEQQSSSSVVRDYRILNDNNTQIIGSYEWSQERPSQTTEYSYDESFSDETWLGENLWSLETSWNSRNPETINEDFKDSMSETPYLIPEKDSHSSRTGPLQVSGSAIEGPTSPIPHTVTTVFTCERCPRTFHKMYLLRYVYSL